MSLSTTIALRKKARPPSAALQPARTPDIPPSCCATYPFRPPMFQRADAPHYFHPHTAYENKTPESHIPQLSQSLGKKTMTIMEIKKPILRLCEQTQRTPPPPAKGLRHLLHRRRLAAPLRKTRGTPRQLAQQNKTAVKPPQGGLKAPPRDAGAGARQFSSTSVQEPLPA